MMATEFVEAPGVLTAPGDLKFPRSVALVRFLESQINPHAQLVETRKSEANSEIVVFEVEVEVSQERPVDIHPRERLAVIFPSPGDPTFEVLALRNDFPYVPHLYIRDGEIPRSLCLYQETFDELKLTWTSAGLVERTRWWLAETAKGKLHGDDQPLEPFLISDPCPLVIPWNLMERLGASKELVPLSVELIQSGSRQTLVATSNTSNTQFSALHFLCPPYTHGVIRANPENLTKLNEILKSVEFDLVQNLYDRLASLKLLPPMLGTFPILVLAFPKRRNEGGEVETYEFLAFLLSQPIGELEVALGLGAWHAGSLGRVVGGKPDEQKLKQITVNVLNPIFSLSRLGAAMFNGTQPNSTRIAAIGLGALGSQVVTNLVRAGFGIWTGIDPDIFLPHNAARHVLGQGDVGGLKVHRMQLNLNNVVDQMAMPTALDVDVLRPGEKEPELISALSNAEIILDFSASLAVGRKLAYYPNNQARRCSIFLNPSGSDLVLLCEGKERRPRLDWLEFQYYRELLENRALHSHFEQEHSRIRYARSCRDLSSKLPQHLIATHSGIASYALQKYLSRAEPAVRIWHADSEMNIDVHEIKTPPNTEMDINGWRLCTDAIFIRKLEKYRASKLPKETGGILIGNFDQENHIVYLVDAIPSPSDSEEWPTCYVRGTHGLESALKRVKDLTDNQMQYIGEWHSHPNAYPSDPSRDDKKVFKWLAELSACDGNPPVMIIIGKRDLRVFLDSIDGSVIILLGKM